jgi:hypothetical protein
MKRVFETALAILGLSMQQSLSALNHMLGVRISGFLFRPRVLAFLIITGFTALMIWGWIAFSSPHMRDQPSIRPYERILPFLPKGVVPVENEPIWTGDSIAFGNERSRSSAGRIYYQYYCAFCHGDSGKGDGPVGISFIPPPSDLLAYSVQSMADSALSAAMVAGLGHVPLLTQVVSPPHRAAIAAFVKSLR